MNDNILKSRYLITMLGIMIICGTVISGAAFSGISFWMSMVFSWLCFLPVILLYGAISSLIPNKNIFQIITFCFPKVFATIIKSLIMIYFLFVSCLVLRNYVEFTVVMALQDTPRLPIIFAIAAVCAYIASKGPSVLGKWSFFIIFVLMASILFTILVSLNTLKIDNLLPIMPRSVPAVLCDGWALGHILIGESIMFLFALQGMEPNVKLGKKLFQGVTLGMIIFILTVLRNGSILGEELLKISKFTSYSAARIIEVGTNLERIESLISINMLFVGVTKLSIAFQACSNGFSSLLPKQKNPKIYIPAVFIIVTALSTIVLDDMTQMFEFVFSYQLYAIFFQVIIPLIILIGALIYKHKNPKENQPLVTLDPTINKPSIQSTVSSAQAVVPNSQTK